MSQNIIKATIQVLLLVLVQVMILNNIHLFGCATPLLLVYAIISLPQSTPRWLSLVLGFVLGLVSDIFANTPGVSAASLLLVAFMQPTLLKLFLNRDTPENKTPSVASLGWGKYMSYSFILTLTHCLMVFSLEQFSFFNLGTWLPIVLGSTAITYIFLLTIESIRKK